MSSYIYALERVNKYAKNNLQTGVKSVYFLDFFQLEEFTFNADFDISNIKATQLFKIDETHQESNLTVSDNNATLTIVLSSNQSDISNKLTNILKNKNIGVFVDLENGGKVFLGYLIDKSKPFRRVRKALVNSSKQYHTGAKNETGSNINKQTYTIDFKVDDLIFFTGQSLKLDVLNQALGSCYIKQVGDNTLNNATITGVQYLESDNNIKTQSNVSNGTIEIGEDNYFYGSISEIIFYGNSISEASFDGIKNSLTSLSIGSNSLSTLDVSNLTSLTSLICGQNSLTVLNVSKLTNLTYLSCHTNSLSTLDVSDLTSLTSIACYSNSISVLDVTALTSLTSLTCYSNSISVLDVSDLTSLTTLTCYSNSISVLDVTNLTKLVTITAYSNNLTALNLSNLTLLRTLFCGTNNISVLDISNCTGIVTLNCYGNNLSTTELDGILSDLVSHNQTNGTLNIANNTGTYTDTTSYNTLISRGWTITA